MFETCDVHESQSFNPFRPPDVRQWSAVSLNLDLAWFVLTTYVREEGRDIGCDQTTLVADEESLLAWLRDTPPEALVALHCVRPGAAQEGRGLWRMVRVRDVWVLSIPEQRQGRLLVCKLWDEEGWFEPNRQDEAKSVGEGRHLLARFEVR
jgi:hypothetical protein